MIETKFKHTDIGLIPEDWEVRTFGEISSGHSYGVAARAIPYNGHTKYIRITDIDDSSHKFVPSPLVSPDYFSESYIVEKDDLLIARTGSSVGKTYLYNENDGELVYAGFLIKAHIDNADSKFIFYSTLTDRYFEWIASESVRTGQPGVNAEQIKRFTLVLPSNIKEQERIGKALSDVDKLIDGLCKLVEKKRAIKKGAMEQLLTCKLRLHGFSEPWETVTLDEIGYLIPNNSLSWEMLSGRGSIQNIHYGDLLTRFNDVLDIENSVLPFVDSAYECKFNRKERVKDGDVIFADTAEDDTVGKAIEVINVAGKEVVSGLHTFWFRPQIEFAKGFLGYAMNSVKFHSQIPPLATGTKVSSISKPNLLKLVLHYPSSIVEQKAIADVLIDMDKEISALEAKLEKYKQVKQGMMQQLLTGKIRLI